MSTVQIDGEIQAAMASASVLSLVIRCCPAPTPIFTGCEPKISKVESCIVGGILERKVCVVHGLGGAGKTQIVLKVIEKAYDKWKEVIYINASSQESIESVLKDFAVAKNVGNTYKATLQWLVVLDNADDPSLSIRDYIPRDNHGSTPSLLLGYPGCVSSVDPDEALGLLLKSAQKQDQELSPEEIGDAKVLLRELGHFALAIVHAEAFIGQSPHMTITDYRSLFMGQKRQALEAYSKLPPAVKVDDYGHTVYIAWLMCYEQLSPQAQELLWLIAFLHHTGITIDILRRAAKKIGSHKPVFPTTNLEDSARQKLQSFLCNFLDADRNWDELLFTKTINEILSHSLLEYDRVNQAYHIHVLVQGWVHTVVPYAVDLVAECARTLLSVSTPPDESLDSIMFRVSIGPHLDKVLLENSDAPSPNHAQSLFQVLTDRGQWAKIELL